MATGKNSTNKLVRTQVASDVKQPAYGPKTSIRVHGSGNYIIITEYSQSCASAKKRIGNSEELHKAVNSGIPVWVDTQRLSKVQLGRVIGAINSAGEVKKEVVNRNGRPMILVRKK